MAVWAQQQRQAIMHWLMSVFVHADSLGKGIERQKLIGEICMKKGCTQRKAAEYISDLLAIGFIEEDSMGLWLKDKSYKNNAEKEVDEILNEQIPEGTQI